eukprot:3632164-Pleurochrysis_carterae.AAC.5
MEIIAHWACMLLLARTLLPRHRSAAGGMRRSCEQPSGTTGSRDGAKTKMYHAATSACVYTGCPKMNLYATRLDF